ncbi:MAG: mannitol-1-phosphate 5-dehydrogenase [Microcella sp.]|uniref:mannitol-1-phosphate 5-dehydrogenase n=1 Tax=Microcella sp. TaxID=1913979 RepID=UPI0024C84CDC|nr:mannitol-1-phosphate 5-dehydrogenase [Microcella sp.]UYN83574.1 MAG: mannitol-1-phosphate 5-dehydrogenase [Microcella sp.]
MTAVHFGAGNIGRGFIGLLLHEAGHDLVFVDVNAPLIAAIQAADSYRVIEIGSGGREQTVTGFTAIDSAADRDAAVAAVATADIATTAVGPSVLRFIAPVIADALRLRATDAAPLIVMACENALQATDQLRADIVAQLADAPEALERAIFANTAVDRIVPTADAAGGLDVRVEPFCEWAIEVAPFGEAVPSIPGAHFVDDLAASIERKLFTVNTGHATCAYLGRAAGYEFVHEAVADVQVRAAVEAALRETSQLLVTRHGFDAEVQDAYRETVLSRFANAALVDPVTRVGRQPLRKLSRHERFMSPAAALAELGTTPVALLAAVGAALRFRVDDDTESIELADLLTTQSPEQVIGPVMGIEPQHPLFDALLAVVSAAADDARG